MGIAEDLAKRVLQQELDYVRALSEARIEWAIMRYVIKAGSEYPTKHKAKRIRL